jgi:hypothetical protein
MTLKFQKHLVVMAAAGAAFVSAFPSLAIAQHAGDRPVVLELFTSQGCSSCPPADALLRELSRTRADVLPLAFHVTYWNNLGWRDPFSFDGATQRQRAYAAALPSEVYTPQLVVDGRADVVGSDRASATAAIRRAAAGIAASVPVTVHRDGAEIVIDVGPGQVGPGQVGAGQGAGTVFLVGYDPEHTTPVGRGENGGSTLVEANIVRSFQNVATWRGAQATIRHPVPAGAKIAVIVQAADGRIIGAARATPDAS